jgi:hypothetical protein
VGALDAVLVDKRLLELREGGADEVADEAEGRLAERAAAPARNRKVLGW